MGSFLSFLEYEHEVGWEVSYELAGISAKEVFKAMTEPDQKKINDVWGRVDMSGMHSVKIIQKSEDGNAGGKGTIYENYDKKGAMVNKHKIVHYEERDGGKSIYTEGTYIEKSDAFPFKIRDKDQIRCLFTDTPNGGVLCTIECMGLIQMRCFCDCCLPMMYPMVKFQKAMQEVFAPKADTSKVPTGKLVMKKELVYNLDRAIRLGDKPEAGKSAKPTKGQESQPEAPSEAKKEKPEAGKSAKPTKGQESQAEA